MNKVAETLATPTAANLALLGKSSITVWERILSHTGVEGDTFVPFDQEKKLH